MLEFASFKRKIKKDILDKKQKEINERDHEQSSRKMRIFYQKKKKKREGVDERITKKKKN